MHEHPSGAGATGRVWVAFGLTAAISLVEVTGGLFAHSLALLSDAGHMVTDLLVLGLSAFALGQMRRPVTARRTFGYHRVGILTALVNALLLAAIVIGIVIEALRRLQHPAPVQSGIMLGAAGLALLVSLLSARLLQPMRDDLTVRSAQVHIRGDAIAAAGVILAALIILVTGRVIWDPLVSIVIGGLIAWSAARVLRSAVDILLESTPRDLEAGTVVQAVTALPGVRDLHDLHIWSLGAQVRAMSAHLLVDDQQVTEAQQILAEVREVLAHRFGIEHTTIQFESAVCKPGDVFCVQPNGHPHLDDAHDRVERRAHG